MITRAADDFPAIRARMDELRGASEPVVIGIDLGWYGIRIGGVGDAGPPEYRVFTAAEIRELEGLTVAPKTKPAPPPPLYPPTV